MHAARLVVRSVKGELGVFLRKDVARDETLLPLHPCPAGVRDLRAIPMDHGTFLRSASDLHCLIRHRCIPSAYVDWSGLAVRALRAMREGEELTVNLLTMYEVVATPFDCGCGDAECYGEIRGFRYLTLDEKVGLELYLSPSLKRLLNEQVLAARAKAS